MPITRQMIAEKMAAYLRHQIELHDLVDWAEQQIMEGEFDSPESRDAVARIGLADVRAFGLTWEDCESLLRKVGFNAHIDIVTA
jgi:cobyrinic acid a,c-diamide synthase